LILVIPESDSEKWQRGKVFGVWLNHGTDSQLAPLSLCELACATMANVRQIIPRAPAAEPLMLLVDPSALDRPVVRLDPVLPDREQPLLQGRGPRDMDDVFAKTDSSEETMWLARIEAVARAVRVHAASGVSFADEAASAAYVRNRWVAKKVPGSHWASSGGCGVDIEEDPPPPDTSCGPECARPRVVRAVGCGMGHVPAIARRFLYLYTRSPYDDEELPT
jgi:hypothetical protein